MAITVYPLNDIDFTAEDVAIYNATRTSGIYAGDDFAISLTGADNTISVDVGLAWMHLSRFNGVAVALKSKTFVDMGLPDAIYPRIDALALQFDANQNRATLVVKQGAASSNPNPPAVSKTEALYELHLLHARRAPGAAYITAADVTDLRLDANYCGLMADAVTRVDTVSINAQVTELIHKLRDKLADVENGDYYASRAYVDTNKVDKSSVVNNYTTTEEGYVADARALKALSDKMATKELVWENAYPNSAFPNQIVSCALDGYDAVLIESRLKSDIYFDAFPHTSTLCFIEHNAIVFAVYDNIDGSGFGYRRVDAYTEGVYFNKGHGDKNEINDSFVIPTAIYGIKF